MRVTLPGVRRRLFAGIAETVKAYVITGVTSNRLQVRFVHVPCACAVMMHWEASTCIFSTSHQHPSTHFCLHHVECPLHLIHFQASAFRALPSVHGLESGWEHVDERATVW